MLYSPQNSMLVLILRMSAGFLILRIKLHRSRERGIGEVQAQRSCCIGGLTKT
jgi:hypothetical protein